MLDLLLTIAAFLIVILILVAVHEFGHLIVARLANVKVLRFSIGFGKVIWSRVDKHGTEFALSLVPLGGYVKMLDETEGAVPENLKRYALNNASPWWRIAIAAAGPAANVLLTAAILSSIYMIGTTKPIPYIGEIADDSPAALAGMVGGEELVQIDKNEVDSWNMASMNLILKAGETAPFEIVTNKDSYLIHVEDWIEDEFGVNPYSSLGFMPATPPIVYSVQLRSPAENAGLQSGDVFRSINENRVYSFRSVASAISSHPETALDVVVERAGVERKLTLVPQLQVSSSGVEFGWAGIQFQDAMREIQYNPIKAIAIGSSETYRYVVVLLDSLYKIFTGQVSTRGLAGPVGIADIAKRSLTFGLESFFFFLAMLSLGLGIFNLLPLPILDGGHIVYALYELVTRKQVTVKMRIIANGVSMVLIAGLIILTLFNDIARIAS